MEQISNKVKMKQEEKQAKKYVERRVEKDLKSSNIKFEDGPDAERMSYDDAEEIHKQQEARLAKFDQEFFGSMDKKFSKYVEKISKLKKTIVGEYTIQPGVPIIPATTQVHYLKKEVLDEAGISVVHVADYTIFEDQFLLGVNFKKLIEDHTPLEAYSRKCDEYREKIKALTSKVAVLDTTQERITELQEHLDIAYQKKQEAEQDLAALAVPAKNAKKDELIEYQNSLHFLQTSVENLTEYYNIRSGELNAKIQERQDLEASLADVQADRDTLIIEYRDFKKASAVEMNSGNKDFTTNVWNAVLAAVGQINSHLSVEDKLVFPETGLNFNQQAGGAINSKGKRPTMLPFGDIAYYWVMKVRVLHKWHEAAGGGLVMHGWGLPKKLVIPRMKGQINKAVTKDASKKVTFESEILRLKRLSTPRETAFKKMKMFLINEGLTMDDYWTKKFASEFDAATSVRMSTKANGPSKLVMRRASSLIKITNPFITGTKK
jgi:hypothetical protein